MTTVPQTSHTASWRSSVWGNYTSAPKIRSPLGRSGSSAPASADLGRPPGVAKKMPAAVIVKEQAVRGIVAYVAGAHAARHRLSRHRDAVPDAAHGRWRGHARYGAVARA